MPTVKKAAAKKSAAKKAHRNIRYISHELMPLEKIAQYHRNPRRGNVRVISESLFEHGQYRPIVIWTHEGGKQRPEPEILAGNHTYKGAKFLDQIAKGQTDKPDWIIAAEKRLGRTVQPWPEMGVVFIDASADEAAEIVLVDNRSADLGEYDNEVLGEIIRELPNAYGTGYSEAEFNLIKNVSEKVAAEALEAVIHLDGYDPEDEQSFLDLSASLVDLETEKLDLETPMTLLDAPEELQGAVQDLKEDPEFSGVGPFEIPPLRPDMLIEELPEDLHTWSGSASKNEDIGDGYWLYNYGIDSTSGMIVKPGHIVLSFYAWDHYFETWWDNCKDRVVQALNTNISMSITPNFSMMGMPMAVSIYSLFRTRYVGRYMQECGIRVMPDLEVRPDEIIMESWKATLPKELPWGAMQAHSISGKTKRKGQDEEAEWAAWREETKLKFDKYVRPANLLVYANDNGFAEIDAMNDKHKWGMKLRHQDTRMKKLAEQAKNRVKKTGLV